MTAFLMPRFAAELLRLAAAIDGHGRAAGECLALAAEIPPAAVLTAIQAGDITAQRLRHAAEAFTILAGAPADTAAGLFAPGCRLQAMQLRAAAADYRAALAGVPEDMIAAWDTAATGPLGALAAICDAVDAAVMASVARFPPPAGDPETLARLVQVLQPRYTVPAERAILAAFLAGAGGLEAVKLAADDNDALENAIL